MSVVAGDLARPRPERARLRLRLRRWQAWALAAAVPVALVAVYAATNLTATLAQRDLRARFEAMRAAGPVSPAALSSRVFAPGEPVARLVAPTVGLDLIVVEGGNGRRGPAHLPSSAIPGLPGRAVVAGGRFGFGNFFLPLGRLRPGDVLVVETLSGVYRFAVRAVEVVSPSTIGVEDSERATLVLLSPARAWGGTDRLAVHADLVSGDNP